MKIKVCKFGGTSLASAESVLRVAEIIRADKLRKIIVVSAPGKRFKGDVKVTDLLITATKAIQNGNKNLYTKSIDDVKKRFYEITDSLCIKVDIEKTFEANYNNPHALISRGEYLIAKILGIVTGYRFCDAYDVFCFGKNGRINVAKTSSSLKEKDFSSGLVIPGFYGRNLNGDIQLFERGGSDVSAAIIARCVKAEIYENWTDVSGIMSANPTIVKRPVYIDELTYKEFHALDVLNPTVLQKSAYKPVIGTKTVTNIRNTFKPQRKGTIIKTKLQNKKPTVLSVAAKDNTAVITGRRLNRLCGLKDCLTDVLKAENIEYIIKFSNQRIIIKSNCESKRITRIIYKKLINVGFF